MKRALLVSVSFHLCMALVLIWPALYLGKRVSVSSVQHVRLIELPKPPPAPPTPVKSKPKPPAPVAKPAPPKPLPPPMLEPAPRVEDVAPPAPPEPTLAEVAEPDVLSIVPVVSTPSIIPKIDAPEFDCADYCRAFQRKVESQWSPPPLSDRNRAQATVVFTIRRDGKIDGDEVSVEATSGNFYFDQAAKRAVLQAAPLPPLPRTFSSPTLRVHLTFTLQPTR